MAAAEGTVNLDFLPKAWFYLLEHSLKLVSSLPLGAEIKGKNSPNDFILLFSAKITFQNY